MIIKAMVLGVVWLFSHGCGRTVENIYYRNKPIKKSYDEVADQVAANCGTCHNGVIHPLKLDNRETWFASEARARLANGSMPPSGVISDQDRSDLLSTF